jgi:hypothetical protein
MKKLFFSILLQSQLVFSQEEKKTITYNYGQNGMELLAKSSKDILIISTYNAKMSIIEEIANKELSLYKENKLENNKRYVIDGENANVTGNCIIRKKQFNCY